MIYSFDCKKARRIALYTCGLLATSRKTMATAYVKLPDLLRSDIEVLSPFEHHASPHKKIDEPVALLPQRNRWVT